MKLEDIYNEYEELKKKNTTVVYLEEEKDENQKIKKIVLTSEESDDELYYHYTCKTIARYEFNEDGNVIFTEDKTWIDDYEITNTKEYYSNGNLKKKAHNKFSTHSGEIGYEKEYDEKGNLIKKKEYNGIYEAYYLEIEYYINKNLTKITEKEYDGDGHIISENTEIVDGVPLFEKDNDAETEIKEYGKIIIPTIQTNAQELEKMSEEELKEIVEKNKKTIDNNDQLIKKSLVEEILNQQKRIAEQQEEILKLESQKKEL